MKEKDKMVEGSAVENEKNPVAKVMEMPTAERDTDSFDKLLEEKRRANGEAKRWRKTLEIMTDITGLKRDDLVRMAELHERMDNGMEPETKDEWELVTRLARLKENGMASSAKAGSADPKTGRGAEMERENNRLRKRVALLEMDAETVCVDSREGLWQLPENIDLPPDGFKSKYAPLFQREARVEIKGGRPARRSRTELRDDARRRGDVLGMLSLNRGKEKG